MVDKTCSARIPQRQLGSACHDAQLRRHASRSCPCGGTDPCGSTDPFGNTGAGSGTYPCSSTCPCSSTSLSAVPGLGTRADNQYAKRPLRPLIERIGSS